MMMDNPIYFPYLRGKQFELILLRDNADLLAVSNIIPIIEPVKSNFNTIVRTVKTLEEKNVKCVIIVNPQAGKSPVDSDEILNDLIDREFKGLKNISIGYILHPKSRKVGLLKLLKLYS